MPDAAIDTVIVFTANVEELVSFYRRAFDLGAPNRDEGHAGFTIGDLYLGFDEVPEPYASPGATTLWFRVDDVHATFARLVALGAAVRYEPVRKSWGDVLAAVFDPDGNIVGLSQRV